MRPANSCEMVVLGSALLVILHKDLGRFPIQSAQILTACG